MDTPRSDDRSAIIESNVQRHRTAKRDVRARFHDRLQDFDLGEPSSKLQYTRKVFSIVATRYDVITLLLSFGRDRRWKRLLIDRLPQTSRRISMQPLSCLDLACGTGDLSRLLARRYPKGTVTAVDLNPDMLIRARARSHGCNIDYRQANMNDLPFADSSFDVVTGGYALRNSPHLETCFREIIRVLKPGGIAAFLEFSTSHIKRVRTLQLQLLAFWGGMWGWIFHRNPEVYSYIAKSLSYYPDFVELPRLMESTGFSTVRQKRLLFGMLALTITHKRGSGYFE